MERRLLRQRQAGEKRPVTQVAPQSGVFEHDLLRRSRVRFEKGFNQQMVAGFRIHHHLGVAFPPGRLGPRELNVIYLA